MTESSPSAPQKHFLRHLFEEGAKNTIRLLTALFILFCVYLVFHEIYKDNEHIIFSCDIPEAAKNIGTETYFLTSIQQGIEYIVEGNRKMSSRNFANAATIDPFIRNEMYSFEVYQKWSLSKILHSVGLVNKYVTCSISVDTSGYACTLSMTNKKNTTEPSKQVKISSKHLDELFSMCSRSIVEYYEPSLVPAYLFSTGHLDDAEQIAEQLLQSQHLLGLTFGGDTQRNKQFWIYQTYINILLEKYKAILKDNIAFNEEIDLRLKNALRITDSLAQKSNSKIDVAASYFLRGAYHSRRGEYSLSSTQFAKAVGILDTTTSKQDTILLTLARTLNNHADILYEINRLDEASSKINQAVSITRSLRASHNSLRSLDQVHGLCLSTQCEILWLTNSNNIEQIRALLIESKRLDKTFLFNKELLITDPIYRGILREAKRSKPWLDFMLSQIENADEKREFLAI